MSPVRKNHLDGAAVAILLACCVFWGAQQVLVKLTLHELAPAFQAGLRFVGATVLVLLWCALRRIPWMHRDGSLGAGLLAGSLFAAEFACIYIGLQHTSASRLTVFLYTSPFWVAGLLPLFVSSERLRPLQWAGLACAFAAVFFVLREGFDPQITARAGMQRAWLGDLLGLTAGMFWGLTTVVIRSSALTRVSPEKLLLYQVAVSGGALMALSAVIGERWIWSWSGFAMTSMLVQTAVGAFASYLAWMWMLGRYPATRISVFVFLTPLFAILFGVWWLAEPLTPNLLVGLALVALGIVLVNRK